jgi:hypothetical protein
VLQFQDLAEHELGADGVRSKRLAQSNEGIELVREA